MTTRHDILSIFYNELQTAVSGLSTQPDIGRKNSDGDLSMPKVSFDVFHFPLSYNNGSKKKPAQRVRDVNGNVIQYIYNVYVGLRFDIEIAARNDDAESPIYEAIMNHFLEYGLWKDDTAFHTSVNDITVLDGAKNDDPSKESTVRGSIIPVEIEWIRQVTRDVDTLEILDVEFDIESDGSVDKTYTFDDTNT